MKRVVLVLLALVFTWFVFIAIEAKAETVTFQWEQEVANLPDLKEWNFYVSDVNGPPWAKFATVPYTTGTGPWTADTSLTITGAPGGTVKKYFAATAVNKDGLESTFATGQPLATEVTKEWRIPWGTVTQPFNFTIKVIIK